MLILTRKLERNIWTAGPILKDYELVFIQMAVVYKVYENPWRCSWLIIWHLQTDRYYCYYNISPSLTTDNKVPFLIHALFSKCPWRHLWKCFPWPSCTLAQWFKIGIHFSFSSSSFTWLLAVHQFRRLLIDLDHHQIWSIPFLLTSISPLAFCKHLKQFICFI